MKNLTLLIKPSSSQCNLRCEYCFYADIVQNRMVGNYGMMAEATLDCLVKRAFEYAESSVNFCFQGGEPMLRGLPFYRRFVTLVEKYNSSHIQTAYTIQTNGILIDDEWAAFFYAQNFLVGISLDGCREIHDYYRISKDGKGTFDNVIDAAKVLTEHEARFNILCVVTEQTAGKAAEVYGFFKEQGFYYLQFIPCMDKLGEIQGQNTYSLTPESYGEFLVKLFNIWFDGFKQGQYISIRMFDNLINMLNGGQPESCDMQGVCSRGTVIEADGSVYPCDFYVLDEWRIGNILVDDFDSMIKSKMMDGFVASSQDITQECRKCDYLFLCRGGCRRNKVPQDESKQGQNRFCSAYKRFYSECIGRLHQVAWHVR